MHPSMFLLGICIFSAPPSCSAKTQQQSRNVRRPKFGVQKTCALTKCQILLACPFFLRIWLLWPSLPTISTVTYMGKQNLQRKPSSGQDQLLNCAVTTRECPHSRLLRPCHQGYLFRRDTRNNISMLSKATEMFDIPFRGPHQLKDDDYEKVNALFDSITGLLIMRGMVVG